jgi:hypothetical protein
MKTWLILAALAVLAVMAFKWMGDKPPQDPVTGMIGNDLKFKSQAEVTVRLTTLGNTMRQQMAGGAIDPVVAKPTLDDIDRLHAEIEDSRRQLATLGDTPAQIDAWLQGIGWDEFQRVEAQFRKAVAAGN